MNNKTTVITTIIKPMARDLLPDLRLSADMCDDPVQRRLELRKVQQLTLQLDIQEGNEPVVKRKAITANDQAIRQHLERPSKGIKCRSAAEAVAVLNKRFGNSAVA